MISQYYFAASLYKKEIGKSQLVSDNFPISHGYTRY